MIEENVELLSFGSHKKVLVKCDFQVSERCRKEWLSAYKDVVRYRKVNNNKDICFFCSRRMKTSGRNNPNTKYFEIDDNFFKNIDTKEKAYILGLIASDGCIKNSGFIISLHIKDKYLLENVSKIIGGKVKIRKLGTMAGLNIFSQEISKDLKKLLNLKKDIIKKSDIVEFPNIEENKFFDFLRGYFDGDGTIRNPNIFRTLECGITSNSIKMLEQIKNKSGIPSTISGSYIRWSSNNALDFLGLLYEKENKLSLIRKRDRYLKWANYIPIHTKNSLMIENQHILKYKKTLKEAVDPFKKNVSDSGFDLTAIKLLKKDGKLYIYETGIIIQPNFGWYLDLVPRSSIYKYGFSLANNVGVIDRTYIDSVKIMFYKIDETKPDPILPVRLAQIIPRQIVHPTLIEVNDEFLKLEYDESVFNKNKTYILGSGDNNTIYSTKRNIDGFGSSGV